MKKLYLLLIIALSSCSATQYASPYITATTVKVTNLAENSGGSGTVVERAEGKSLILTNAHVCKVVEHGGIVTSTVGVRATVASYVVSQIHDLCLITVYKDFLYNATLSDVGPISNEDATVSGHPQLYPNVVTKGHFSENKVMPIMYGYRECTMAEATDPATQMLCLLVGKMPLVKNYEATLVTATIMAGSSGSGVFNSQGYLTAVVFAGSDGLSYGLAVPYGYVRNFLLNEAKTLDSQTPDMNVNFAEDSSSKKTTALYIEVCAKNEDLVNNKVCEYVLKQAFKASGRR